METVLLVEDDKFLRRGLRLVLERASYRVEEASSVEGAIAKLASNSFALIVTDYDLGSGPTGLTFLAELRKHQSRAPIILMSGYNADWMGPAAIDLGALFFLQKPFDMDEFLDVTGQALNVSSGVTPYPVKPKT